jgi:tetratricopeptide (TPR) repeat protein
MESSGTVGGNLVQAGAIHGGVHFHEAESRSAVVPRQLPRAVRQFVNRAVEQDALTTLLRSRSAGEASVISSIDGTAGIGKSTLVVYWAHRARDEFVDGELYVNLRGFDPVADPVTPGDALGVLLAGLGVEPERIPADLAARTGLFRSLVHDKRILVFLDNAFSADQVRPLLPGSATAMVLVTSRNRLEDLVIREGAARMTLQVLTQKEARELLGRYLGDHRIDSEREAVDALIAHCGGLPLALSIVAYRAAEEPDFPLEVLVDELRSERDRLDALDVGGESGVRSVFSWSYRALSPSAARLFRLLGLPTGPDISLAAAADLAGLPQRDTRALLAELTRAHLAEQHEPGRYRFHDLIRAYAAECAANEENPDDRQAAVRRLLDHYLRTSHGIHAQLEPHARQVTPEPPASDVAGLAFADPQSGKDWWEVERRNLVAATALASKVGMHEHAWLIPHCLRHWYKLRSYTDDWISTHDIGLGSARELGDESAEAYLLLNLGSAYYTIKMYDRSAVHKERSLELFEKLGDRPRTCLALLALAEAYVQLHHFDEALKAQRRAMEVARELGDVQVQGIAHSGLGAVHAELKQCDQAVMHFEDALTCYRSSGEKIGIGFVLHFLAGVHQQAGRAEDAVNTYREAVAHRQAIGHRQGEAMSLRRLGASLKDVGDTATANKCWEQALAIFEELGSPDADEVRALLTQ